MLWASRGPRASENRESSHTCFIYPTLKTWTWQGISFVKVSSRKASERFLRPWWSAPVYITIVFIEMSPSDLQLWYSLWSMCGIIHTWWTRRLGCKFGEEKIAREQSPAYSATLVLHFLEDVEALFWLKVRCGKSLGAVSLCAVKWVGKGKDSEWCITGCRNT